MAPGRFIGSKDLLKAAEDCGRVLSLWYRIFAPIGLSPTGILVFSKQKQKSSPISVPENQ